MSLRVRPTVKTRVRALLLAVPVVLLLPPVVLSAQPAAGTAPALRESESLSALLALPPLEKEGFSEKDPFQPVSSGAAKTVENVAPPSGPSLPPLRVSAIVSGPGRAAAVIDGRIVRQGDHLQGVKVVKITDNEVWLSVGEKVVSLMLKEILYTIPQAGRK